MSLQWSLQTKIWLCVGSLCAIVALLSGISLNGVYAYRELVRSLSVRAVELPLAGELSQGLGDLRVTLSRARALHSLPDSERRVEATGIEQLDVQLVKHDFRRNLLSVQNTLQQYQETLETSRPTDPRFQDNSHELATLDAINSVLKHLMRYLDDPAWMLDQLRVESLAAQVDEMYELANTLPQHLHTRLHAFADDVKVTYRAWIVVAWTSTVLTAFVLGVTLFLFYRWIIGPIQNLIAGSRIIAGGNFQHRVEVRTSDEIAELAHALNDMTTRFREIRDDLDRKVKERTKEVLQSEQLASVGFLAAGVAHEINNPLASIAWAAESLEGRVGDAFGEVEEGAAAASELAVIQKYLRCIQTEAFRCKGITERLLDFSRLGDMQMHDTNLGELVEGVIGMVRHIGKYRDKQIEFQSAIAVIAPVEAQQLKQVVLNLVTNSLDSLDPGGTVWVEVRKAQGKAEIIVRDNGCGMTDEVREHLFEPFFTRRRDGSGTGLGLSITYRIVQDHGGSIVGQSAGPGTGSRFCVTLPLIATEKQYGHAQRQEKRVAA